MNPFSLGLILTLVGLFLCLLAWLLIKAPLTERIEKNISLPRPEDLLSDNQEAVFVLRPGGKIITLNQAARQLFKLSPSDSPRIDTLAQKVQPENALWDVFAGISPTRFIIDGQLIEASLRPAPRKSDPWKIISFKHVKETSLAASSTLGKHPEILKKLSEINRKITSSPDLLALVRAILENSGNLVEANFTELTLSEENGAVLGLYHLKGLPGETRQLEYTREPKREWSELTSSLFAQQEPLFLPDLDQQSIHSYIGIPLISSGRMVGAFELISLIRNHFSAQDFELMSLFCSQASVILDNHLLHQAVERRNAEIQQVTALTREFSTLYDADSIFSHLVQVVSSLIRVEILGFVIYNEEQNQLEAKNPFLGLPPPFLEFYRLTVPPDSEPLKNLKEKTAILTSDASTDPTWEALGISYIAQAASIHDAVLQPLVSGSHLLGFLQVANHLNGSRPFTTDELNLLSVITNQISPIIESVFSSQQSRKQSRQIETLQRIANLTTLAFSFEDTLRLVVQELVQLLRCDFTGVFLLDSSSHDLQILPSSYFGDSQLLSGWDKTLNQDDPQFLFTVSGSQHPVIYDRLSEEYNLSAFYQQMVAHWKIESAVVAPLVFRNLGLGELWLGKSQSGGFGPDDLKLVQTVANHLAVYVGQSYQADLSDSSLKRKSDWSDILVRSGREFRVIQDTPLLLQKLYERLLNTTGASCGSIVLFSRDPQKNDRPGDLLASAGEPLPSRLSDRAFETFRTGKTTLVRDFHLSDIPAPHADAACEVVVPLPSGPGTGGLVILHHSKPNAFDELSIDFILSLCDEAGQVLKSLQALEETAAQKKNSQVKWDTTSQLLQNFRLSRPARSLQEAMQTVCASISSAAGFTVVIFSTYDPLTRTLHRVNGVGLSSDQWNELRSVPLSWKSVQDLLIPENRISSTFYILRSRQTSGDSSMNPTKITWKEGERLAVFLYSAKGSLLGALELDNPAYRTFENPAVLEAIEFFIPVMVYIVENQKYINTLAASLTENEKEAGAQLASTRLQEQVSTLLHKDLQQTLSIQNMGQQLERLQRVPQIIDATLHQDNVHRSLNTAASELLLHFNQQTALIAESSPAGAILKDVIGSLPPGVNLESLFGQRNPLRQVLSSGELLLIPNLEKEPEWNQSALLNALHTRQVIGLPLKINQEHNAAILLVSSTPAQDYTQDDRLIFNQLSRQISVHLQNLELLAETRHHLQEVNLLLDFTRKLGNLDPASILKILTETILQAIPDAQACWVGLWDEKQRILYPKASTGYADATGLLDIRFPTGARDSASAIETSLLPVRCLLSGKPLRVDEIQFAQDYNLPSEDLLRFRRATGGILPVSSMLVPLRRGENISGVLVMDNFNTAGVFDDPEEMLAQSLAQQAALVLENASLFVAAENRSSQLQALTTVAGIMTRSLESDELIRQILEQLSTVLPYETATLWLKHGEQLTIAAARGFEDNETRQGLSVSIRDSLLFQEMLRTGQVLSVGDVRLDNRFPSFIEPENLSWLGIPLISKSELIGVLALEKKEPYFYTEEHLQIGVTFASQAAAGLENAWLFEESNRRATELDQRSQRLALLNRFSTELGSYFEIDPILEVTCQYLLDALGSSRVSAVSLDQEQHLSLQVETPASGTLLPLQLPDNSQMEHLRQSQGIYSTHNIAAESGLASLWESFFKPRGSQSVLMVPLVTNVCLYGWLWLEQSDSRRFSPAEIELALTITNQAVIALQNAFLLQETRSLTNELEIRVLERTADLQKEHHQTQTMLEIIMGLSTSMELDDVISNTLKVLNKSLGAEQSMIIRPEDAILEHQEGIELVVNRQKNHLPALKQIMEIARWSMNKRDSTLISDILENETWPLPRAQAVFRSLLAVPLILGNDVKGSLVLLHSRPGIFASDQLQLLEAAARQISISVNNAELFQLLRVQTDGMGNMLREQEIAATRSRAILEAVADGVLVTDSDNRINFFNISAERMLNLDAMELISQPLEQFIGLFGGSAQSWMETIHSWSENPISYYMGGSTFAEQLKLENGTVVSVHLAPVIYGAQFLGTVSIFRDITHEVQVDRLKSEFVANVSHELRTPMTSIKGYVEILLMGAAGELTPQAKNFLQIVKTNTERLAVLVNDLLDVSRIESGKVTLSFQPLDMEEITQDVLAEMKRRSQNEEKAMTFEVKSPARLPVVYGDQERVHQILGNLVGNSYNYTPAGGHVIVHLHQDGNVVQVDVEDNGVGIPHQDQGRIFDRFYRGENRLVLATAGTGLGLAISKILVEMHHGTIWFTSSGVPGEGSVFSFTLPIYKLEG